MIEGAAAGAVRGHVTVVIQLIGDVCCVHRPHRFRVSSTLPSPPFRDQNVSSTAHCVPNPATHFEKKGGAFGRNAKTHCAVMLCHMFVCSCMPSCAIGTHNTKKCPTNTHAPPIFYLTPKKPTQGNKTRTRHFEPDPKLVPQEEKRSGNYYQIQK